MCPATCPVCNDLLALQTPVSHPLNNRPYITHARMHACTHARSPCYQNPQDNAHTAATADPTKKTSDTTGLPLTTSQRNTHLDVVSLDLTETPDVHAITGLLKLYFRELAEPAFTEELYPQFIAAGSEAASLPFVRRGHHPALHDALQTVLGGFTS